MENKEYAPLWEWIKKNKKTDFELSFSDIEQILNFKINHAFLNHKKELLDYGYEVKKISMKEKKIIFTKIH